MVTGKNLVLLLILLLLGSCGFDFMSPIQQVTLTNPDTTQHPSYEDSFITLEAGPWYYRTFPSVILYGKNYRPVWTAPVNMPVMDLNDPDQQWRIVEEGGSRQTISLRLVNSNGKEFVLRSLDKDPAGGMPFPIRDGYLGFLFRDVTSSSNPYGALTIPTLAEAIHIYHTNPHLFYLPHDAKLGQYLANYGGMMALLEERPDDDQSVAPFFGNSPEVMSTKKMMKNRLSDLNNRIDARFYLRCRMLDILTGDWSRHEDNWRWASFKSENGYRFRPIPRDRDHVYFHFRGLLPWIAVTSGFKKNFQTFDYSISNLKALNVSAWNLDRTILTELSWEDWIEIADSVRLELTDETIDRAMREFPDTIFQLVGKETGEILKYRRDNLSNTMREYYQILNQEIFAIGSDAIEKVTLAGIENGSRKLSGLRIEFWRVDSFDHEDLLWTRTLGPDEVKVLNLVLLGGNDQVEISGDMIQFKINIWGGDGNDKIFLKEFDTINKSIRIMSDAGDEIDDPQKVTVKSMNVIPPQYKNGGGWIGNYYLGE